MQEVKVYSIYDTKAKSYGNIFTCLTDGLASRVFANIALCSGNPDYTRYPEDFALYCVGSFMDGSGDLVPARPQLVCTLMSVLQHCQKQGAAVGDGVPLKSQSVPTGDSASDTAQKETPVDDEADRPFNQPKTEEA